MQRALAVGVLRTGFLFLNSMSQMTTERYCLSYSPDAVVEGSTFASKPSLLPFGKECYYHLPDGRNIVMEPSYTGTSFIVGGTMLLGVLTSLVVPQGPTPSLVRLVDTSLKVLGVGLFLAAMAALVLVTRSLLQASTGWVSETGRRQRDCVIAANGSGFSGSRVR